MSGQKPTSDDQQSAWWRDPVVLAAIVAAAVQIVLVWGRHLPLGIPGEWEWQRIPYASGDGAALFLALFLIVPVAIAYLWFARAGERRITSTSRTGRRWWLAGLVVAGFGWLWSVQEAAPSDIYRLGRMPVVLYFPSFSGYFTEARDAADFRQYLATYEDLMAEGDVLHIGTHPPGLTTTHYALLSLFRASPELTDLILALRPSSVRETEAMLLTLPQQPGNELRGFDLAELWAAGLLVQIAAAAAVVPLFVLTERSAGTTAAWRTAVLWPLVPAVAIFLPKSDAVFPLIGLGILALWHGSGPPGMLRAAAAGALFWYGMTLSLAMLPVAALAGLLTAQTLFVSPGEERKRVLFRFACATVVAAAAFLGLTAIVWLVFDLNLAVVWSWNYRNHAGFYEAYDRRYWKWLLVGPAELAVAVGLPITVALAVGLRRTISASPAVPVLAVIALLWLSGKNSGEAARLWLFLMPWLLWIATPAFEGGQGERRWWILLPLQLVVSFLTVVRVSGFGFDEFLNAGM